MKKKPANFRITVVDSAHGTQNLDEYYEILVRLLLLLFAMDPDEFSAVHSRLGHAATTYGTIENHRDERLMSPKLFEAMKNDKEVSYRTLYILCILLIIDIFRL